MPNKVVALCFPGKSFDSDFVYEWSQLIGYCLMQKKIGVVLSPAKGCNVHEVRGRGLYQAVNAASPIDYLFTIDSDQLNILDAFQALFITMEARPDIEVLAGWTYMQANQDGAPVLVNCGDFILDPTGEVEVKNHIFNYTISEEKEILQATEPIKKDWVGFGCVMVSKSAIDKLIAKFGISDVFSAVYKGEWVSDDTGFSLRCREAGIDIWVLPDAYVKHMKERELKPIREGKVVTAWQ